jgi:hypothetical protein
MNGRALHTLPLRAVFGHATTDIARAPIIGNMAVRAGRMNVTLAALYTDAPDDAAEVVQKVVFSLN